MSNAEDRETIYVVLKSCPVEGSIDGDRSIESSGLGYYFTEDEARAAIAAHNLPSYDDVARKLNCTDGPFANSEWDDETWYEVWDINPGQ